MGVLAPSTDEEDSEREGKPSSNGFIMSPAVGVLVGVVVALVVMALIIVIVMRIQSPPPTRRTYFEEENLSKCYLSLNKQCNVIHKRS
ncbi:hypothetical protein TNCT_301091 [Trichonephila clavata]|uniref:Uncharacterized protein n=1 Tax=Trichonephila clavata TaxID=2740835 RepID=A0A8X6KZ79_TRICU|nr:hypothetical protein TNCT_301091 [Trichonephila clavata]